jgi:hypothetical protein
MATDRGLGPDSNESSGTSVETGRLVRELVEALTAMGNYLDAINRMLAGETKPGPELLADVLDKTMAQYERAANVARQLQKLDVRRSRGDEGPPSFRR